MYKSFLLTALCVTGVFSKAQAQFIALPNGNVGIGVNPAAQLHTTGSVWFQGMAGAGSRLLQASAAGVLSPIASGTTGQVLMQGATGLSWANPALAANAWNLTGNTGNTASHFLGTSDNQPIILKTNGLERLRVLPTGEVGIGTSTMDPDTKLQVVGQTTLKGRLQVITSTINDMIDGVNEAPANTVQEGSSTLWVTYKNPQNKNPYLIQASTAVGSTQNYIERFGVKANGEVRIGDPHILMPAGYRLYVQGGILTEKVKVAVANSANWADYVFANDYKLMPLNQVEAFVKTEKHLPNVPSATEVAANGIDMTQMFAKQMEKIEELTLYLIELNKKVETLKQENVTLKTQMTAVQK